MAAKIVTYNFIGARQDTTGLGSYTRSLAHAIKSLGAELTLLLGRQAKWRAGALPQEQAMAIFGNDMLENLPRLAPLLKLSSWLSNPYRTKKAFRVDTNGIDIRSFASPLPEHDRLLNVNNLHDSSKKAFFLTGRFTRIDIDQAVDLVHWPTAALPARVRGVPNVYTIHDLIPIIFPHLVLDRGAYYAKLFASIANQADMIVAISERTREDVLRILKVPEARVHVAYQSLATLPHIDQNDAERLVDLAYGLTPDNYAIFVGAIEPKKNLARLMEAFLLAGVDIPLALVGPLGWLYDREMEFINRVAANFDHPRQAPIRWLGYLPRRHVVALLKCARFFVFPSLYEGFGLPVVEAMSLGVPVLTSKAGALPEVSGDAAQLVNPLDVAEIARGIRTLAADIDLRAELKVRGPRQAERFSPMNHAKELQQAYRRVGVSVDS